MLGSPLGWDSLVSVHRENTYAYLRVNNTTNGAAVQPKGVIVPPWGVSAAPFVKNIGVKRLWVVLVPHGVVAP